MEGGLSRVLTSGLRSAASDGGDRPEPSVVRRSFDQGTTPRNYAIQAEGLVSALRVQEAQSAMKTLRLETCGYAPLNRFRST
jgi:hypothetical protein